MNLAEVSKQTKSLLWKGGNISRMESFSHRDLSLLEIFPHLFGEGCWQSQQSHHRTSSLSYWWKVSWLWHFTTLANSMIPGQPPCRTAGRICHQSPGKTTVWPPKWGRSLISWNVLSTASRSFLLAIVPSLCFINNFKHWSSHWCYKFLNHFIQRLQYILNWCCWISSGLVCCFKGQVLILLKANLILNSLPTCRVY